MAERSKPPYLAKVRFRLIHRVGAILDDKKGRWITGKGIGGPGRCALVMQRFRNSKETSTANSWTRFIYRTSMSAPLLTSFGYRSVGVLSGYVRTGSFQIPVSG